MKTMYLLQTLWRFDAYTAPDVKERFITDNYQLALAWKEKAERVIRRANDIYMYMQLNEEEYQDCIYDSRSYRIDSMEIILSQIEFKQ